MATQAAIEQRKSLEADDVTVDLIVDDQNVRLRFCINDDFTKKARDYIDKLLQSRDIPDPGSITKMNTDVSRLAESVPIVKPVPQDDADDEMPSWMSKGIKLMPQTALDWALAYIRKDVQQSQQNATIDGFMAALAATCRVILTDDDNNEMTALSNGVFEHYKLKKYPGVTFVRFRSEIHCDPIPDDYFDDSENNRIRAENMLPKLPVRVPFHPVEQKVAWLATLRDTHEAFSIQLETFFNRYINVLMEAAYSAVISTDVDDEGFQRDAVEPNVAKKARSNGKRTRRHPNTADT